MRRVGIFGWGIVAPRSPNIEAFEANLNGADSWLEPFNGYGPDSFLVGRPAFDLEAYRPWINERFPPNRYRQIESKMGQPVQYAVGAFIQALGQNPGLEAELKALGTEAHIYIGTGLGDMPTHYEQSLRLYRSQRHWNRFWASAERNSALRAYFADRSSAAHWEVPPSPDSAPELERDVAEDAWWDFWSTHSPELQSYLDDVRAIESIAVEGEVEAGKLAAMKEKSRRHRKLQQKWGAPEPPWQSVSPNLIWNIDNIPASQVSMLAGITGMTICPLAACSTFGVTLKMAIDAIHRGEAKAVVLGATDPAPHPLVVGAFYAARVIAADGQVSKPLTELRGTHVAGGSAIWIVGDLEYMTERGLEPLGMEPVSVGVTADADHIITPSKEGPTTSMRMAMEGAGVAPEAVASWDLHATATPGDFNEVEMVHQTISPEVLVTARKGTFGHGMSAGGGWELTAQYLGYQHGRVFPTPLAAGELNAQIAEVHDRFAFDTGCAAPDGPVGKLSMGIGGINACVVSRPLVRSSS